MSFNAKLFLSTFVLIFLAELGDKTQLAAMAKSIEGRMTVFLAASLALVCSTLIAVLFGKALSSIIPEKYIQMAAAVLFILFGAVMLYNVLTGKEAAVAGTVRAGTFDRFIIQMALPFEEAAEKDYRKLAATTDNAAVRKVLLALAEEERSHQMRIKEANRSDRGDEVFETETEAALPDLEDLLHDVAGDQARPIIEHAIEHELATAAFYHELANTAKLPGLKRTLHTLAQEEQTHADMLRDLQDNLTDMEGFAQWTAESMSPEDTQENL
ncbi:MAG: TMEM165/GDT1 family protein [Phycisphaerae bacterium]|nr:TMEM165/GDT1 family protein [Phycisphaerae bacterium]